MEIPKCIKCNKELTLEYRQELQEKMWCCYNCKRFYSKDFFHYYIHPLDVKQRIALKKRLKEIREKMKKNTLIIAKTENKMWHPD